MWLWPASSSPTGLRIRHAVPARDLPGRLAGAVLATAALPLGPLALSMFPRGLPRVLSVPCPVGPGCWLPWVAHGALMLGLPVFSPRVIDLGFRLLISLCETKQITGDLGGSGGTTRSVH